MANIITCTRIVCSVALLFCKALSPAFYALYITAGLTDMIDGTVAKKTNTVSEFGAKLDTVADFLFVLACFIKFFPLLSIPLWLYIWIALIAVIKIAHALIGFILHRKLVAVHNGMNKMVGAMLFLLPLTLSFIDFIYGAIVVCTVATVAAIAEGDCIRKGKTK